MSDVAAEVRNLRMLYGATEVLSGVDFSLRTGEVVAMLGPNGAGKTTTIEILEGFRMRSAGEVTLFGEDPAHAGEAWRARIGVVLQSWRDHAKWRVRELLRHLGTYYARYGTPEVARPWDVDELLDLVGLSAHANARIGTLSGGQRLAGARGAGGAAAGRAEVGRARRVLAAGLRAARADRLGGRRAAHRAAGAAPDGAARVGVAGGGAARARDAAGDVRGWLP
jgi:predicted ABC-type transport system involved in lysophospholipase L1 biosynthesis ATPase subunit